MADKFIKYGDRTLAMPAHMTLDEAKAVMARHFPELAENPKIETKKDGDNTTYVFSKQAGRKGAKDDAKDVAHAARNLDRLKPAVILPSSLAVVVLHSGGIGDRGGIGNIDLAGRQVEERVKQASRVSAALLECKPSLDASEGVLLL